MSRAGGEGRSPRAARARQGLRRGSEMAAARVARGLGQPAIAAINLSTATASLFFTLGVVAGGALGLTPLVFLLAGLFLMVSVATYVEGSSLHIERGGASAFARYAFDEFWSFVAGWAILLDYLIVMAIGAVAISQYLAPFWSGLDSASAGLVIAAAALGFVGFQNVRGLSAERLGMVLRLSLFTIGLLALLSIIAFVQHFDVGAITDSIDLGSAPEWDAAVFAMVVATAGLVGVEASSGLAGEVRVGRRGLRRVVLAIAAVTTLLFLVVSAASLMAVPVSGGETRLGNQYLEAPVLGLVSAFEPVWLMDVSRYVVAATAMIVPLALASRFRWFIRIGLVGYAATTILGWAIQGPYYSTAFVAKGIEVALIALLVVDFARFDGNPVSVVRREVSAGLAFVKARREGLAGA